MTFEPLRQQLLDAARAFASDAQPLADLLAGLVSDVERACGEPLEIFPVCHHSPSSAVQMVRRLEARPPRVIYVECCEDLRGLLDGLRDCKLPVALQAFASSSKAFPPSWSPLNLVCPLTDFSAEFQAMAFALEHPKTTELVFVDRSADHVFQWMPQKEQALEGAIPERPPADDEEAAMHGAAVGVEMGSLLPSFDEFRHFLLKNARVRHFTEWWDQYVEEAVIDGGYAAYREVFFLVGSLFRRLGTVPTEHREDELRERFMWTRIKQHLAATSIDPRDALYVCGAAHGASHVAEFGVESPAVWDIPPRTPTEWLYGLLPSSHSAIEHQFGHPRGAVTLAEARWKRSLARSRLRPFALVPTGKKKVDEDGEPSKPTRGRGRRPVTAAPSDPPTAPQGGLLGYLQQPPPAVESDEEGLLANCVRIVDLARRNGYLASTADGIAIYQTSMLLAGLRNRRHPTPYDFRDAAVTCLEKEAVPGRRDVARLCDLLLGGDRVGHIGYASLPPLVQDVYRRLAPLPVKLDARTIQRALLDFRRNPELLPCSDLLWKLRYLLAGDALRPIMGRRQLGHVPQQESWDVAIGKHQGAVIQLGYEGVTVEQVVERRLRKAAWGPESRTVDALTAAEDSLLLLDSERLTEELGERAVALLVQEPDVKHAQDIHRRITRLVHHYRTTPGGLPAWVQRFVTTGYSHYATLLPTAFSDRGVKPEDLAAMLQFVFTLESLALSLGCQRSQLVIAIRQAAPVTADHPKLALLWSAECILQLRDLASLRAHFDHLLDNELTLPSLPDYLGGFLLALAFTPLVAGLTVELMSKAFERLPDRLLMPWLPRLLMMLRPHADTALPILVKEAAGLLPGKLDALSAWTPPWYRTAVPVGAAVAPLPLRTPGEETVAALLSAHPATTDALAASLGVPATWVPEAGRPVASGAPSASALPPELQQVGQLLREWPQSVAALAGLLPGSPA